MTQHEPWRPNEPVMSPYELFKLITSMDKPRASKAVAVCTALDNWLLANMEDYRESQNRNT